MRLALLLAGLLTTAAAAQPAVPFAADGDCVALGAERVCLVPGDVSAVTVTRDGRRVARWEVAAPMGFSRVAAFRTRVGGADGLAVGVLEAVSNGLGVSYWRLYALPDGADAPAYSFLVEDLATDGASFGGTAAAPVLWATTWERGPDPTGRRGPGMYFIGRPVRLGAGGLRPAADLPVRARRLLTPFQREPGGPVGWLSSRRAVRWPDGAGRPSGASGEVRAVASASDGFTLDVAVGGRARTFAVDTWTTPEGATDAALGDAATGRLFPPQYRPGGLVGRTVRVAETASRVTLWL